jgi:hypothetical protein
MRFAGRRYPRSASTRLLSVVSLCVFMGLVSASPVLAARPTSPRAVGPRPATSQAPNLPPKGYGTGPGYCSQWGVSSTTAPYSFDDVYACSPRTTKGNTPFDENGAASFQCVDLSARFLWAIDGLWAGPGSGVEDGADLVNETHVNYLSIPVGSPGPGSVPGPGDIISLYGGPSRAMVTPRS